MKAPALMNAARVNAVRSPFVVFEVSFCCSATFVSFAPLLLNFRP